MAPNLRLSLTIFSIGFAIESGVDVYHVVTGSVQPIAGGYLFLLGIVATILGLSFLWIGRHEWNELHTQRVRHAHLAFASTVALGAAAAGPAAYYGYTSPDALPGWLGPEVGAAVGVALLVTVWMYIVIVLHLVGGPGKAVLVLSMIAAAPVAYLLGLTVSQDLPVYLHAATAGPRGVLPLAEPALDLLSWLFASYLLLLVAFADAHRRVARGQAAVA